MKYNFLGTTGLRVSELCLGTMTFGGEGYWGSIGKLQQSEVTALIGRALELGINFFDTANIYSYGGSEALLGEALKTLGKPRHELVLATKVSGKMGAGVNNVGLSRYQILHSVEASLNRLQTDHIDVLYAHGVDLETPLEQTLRAFNDVVQTGRVHYIGICNWPAWMVMKAQGIAERQGWSTIAGLQYYYSLAGREIEREIVPLALDQKFALLPWSPLAGGFLSGKYSRHRSRVGDSRRDDFDFPPIDKPKMLDLIDAMDAIGGRHGASVAQVALAWVRSRPAVTSTLIGAKTVAQLEDNVRSVALELTAAELQQLDAGSAIPGEYPGWMVQRQSGDRKLAV
jgi:aryl-alcohol dehydrogenase-like predicted oxidoreductase